MTALEEGQRLLNSLTTFYIIVTRNPDGFAQATAQNEKFILVWSSRGKAKRFLFGQGLSTKDSRIVGMDGAILQAFRREANIRKMFLDCTASPESSGPVMWFYFPDTSAQ